MDDEPTAVNQEEEIKPLRKILSSISVDSFNSITAQLDLNNNISTAIEELSEPDRSIAWNRITSKKKIQRSDWLITYFQHRLNWSDAFVDDIFSDPTEQVETKNEFSDIS